MLFGVGVVGGGGVLVEDAVEADEFDTELTRVADGVDRLAVCGAAAAAVPNIFYLLNFLEQTNGLYLVTTSLNQLLLYLLKIFKDKYLLMNMRFYVLHVYILISNLIHIVCFL